MVSKVMARADCLFRGAGLGHTVPWEFVLAVTTPHPRLSELNQATVQPSLEGPVHTSDSPREAEESGASK